MDRNDTDIARDESDSLISADKVKGTAVYDASGDRIGTIDDVMLTKRSGKVAYAIMSFGGFLGIGEKYHPLPWDVLGYDVDMGGYRVGMAGEGFRDAPSYGRDELSSDSWASSTDDYYDDAVSSGRMTRSSFSPSSATIGGRAMVGGSVNEDRFQGATPTGGALGTGGSRY